MTRVINVHGQTAGGRRERKKAAVRICLYDAAIALFRSRGFDGTPVEAITEQADVAKGTFFNYFPTKDHVLPSADLQNSQRFMDWFGAVLTEGVASGELRRDLDLAITLSMLAAVLGSTMNGWVMDPDAFDLRDVLRQKTAFVFDAARARPATRTLPRRTDEWRTCDVGRQWWRPARPWCSCCGWRSGSCRTAQRT